jgi:hypothetical protein
MPQIERSPKFRILRFSQEQLAKLESLTAEKDLMYKKWHELEETLRVTVQDFAGKSNDWELDESKQFLVITPLREK